MRDAAAASTRHPSSHAGPCRMQAAQIRPRAHLAILRTWCTLSRKPGMVRRDKDACMTERKYATNIRCFEARFSRDWIKRAERVQF